jgi:hypothetical protein
VIAAEADVQLFILTNLVVLLLPGEWSPYFSP